MSLTFSKGHKPIAAIRGTKRLEKLEGKILSAKEHDFSKERTKGPTRVKIEDGEFCPVPGDKFRETFYIFGANGKGKSVLAGHIMAEYQHKFPDKPIFVVSRKDCDEAFEGIHLTYLSADKFIAVDPTSKRGKLKAVPMICQDFEALVNEIYQQRVHEYEQLMKDIKAKKIVIAKKDVPDPPERIDGCLVVYDDIDSMDAVCEELKESVQKSIKDVLNVGRNFGPPGGPKFHISVIVTSHLGADYRQTATVLNEVQNIVCFPRGSSPKGITYVMKTYGNLDDDEIKKLFKLPSRWVCVRREEPSLVIYQSGCYMTNLPSDSDLESDSSDSEDDTIIKKNPSKKKK